MVFHECESRCVCIENKQTTNLDVIMIVLLDPVDGDIRLDSLDDYSYYYYYDDSTSNNGRLEIYYQGVWGSVCYDDWDYYDAQVACRQLGYSTEGATAYSENQGSTQVHLGGVYCEGYESRLDQCSHSGWDDHTCEYTYSHDAAVSCPCECLFSSSFFLLSSYCFHAQSSSLSFGCS